MHHIISDGWSMEVLANDVFEFYEALKANQPPKLNDLRIQYKDYAAWQLGQLEDEEFLKHKSFWLTQFAGEQSVINLPSTHPRPRIKTNSGHGLRTYIDAATTAQLKQYSQDNGGTLFIGLLSAWNVLLHHYTSLKNITIGTPIAGREHADLKDQIGFYLNTLALKNDINPDDSFNEFYANVKANTLDSYGHQMYPFDRLVEDLKLQRDTSRSAIFDVMLILQNFGEKIENLNLKKEEVDSIVDQGNFNAKFDLSITFQEVGDYLEFQIVYNSDVYEQSMIARLIQHYKQLLPALLNQPKMQVGQFNFLSANEQESLLLNSEINAVELPQEKSVIQLFEEQAARTPNDCALGFKEQELTFAQLDELSNQLANFLIDQHKVVSKDFVGIKQERSEWMIVSLLAVLKSGAAYVPIDPEFPQSRIDFIENDTQYKVCLDEEELEKFATSKQNYSNSRLNISSSPKDLAYVIYTSGSTGNPKGVMVSNEAVVDYTFGILDKTNMQDCKRFGHISTFAADLGNTVIYPALLNGGALHIIAQTDILKQEQIIAANVDCIKMTPSHWKALQNDGSSFMPNKCLILGGESISESILSLLSKSANNCEVYNHYGPTETTIGKLIHRINPETDTTNVPIGKVMGNNQAYVLNSALNLCPQGVPGEICIGGNGLANGYLNDPELTHVKFVPHPFKEGELLYKTGDIGISLQDGNIAFAGRIDDQIKIRGYRIELGEIENTLSTVNGITQVAVLPKMNQNKEMELVAYLTANEELTTADIRSQIKQLLPNYMIPALFVKLDVFPLTVNGKVDKKALPNAAGLGLASGVEYVAPKTNTELEMVKIWEEILIREKIGVKDDFFTLGGHSISAIKMMSKIQEKFEVRLNLEELFNEPTIISLASYIDAMTLIGQQEATVLDEEDELLF
jgi:amino acid adenylation domain-containing protein